MTFLSNKFSKVLQLNNNTVSILKKFNFELCFYASNILKIIKIYYLINYSLKFIVWLISENEKLFL